MRMAKASWSPLRTRPTSSTVSSGEKGECSRQPDRWGPIDVSSAYVSIRWCKDLLGGTSSLLPAGLVLMASVADVGADPTLSLSSMSMSTNHRNRLQSSCSINNHSLPIE